MMFHIILMRKITFNQGQDLSVFKPLMKVMCQKNHINVYTDSDILLQQHMGIMKYIYIQQKHAELVCQKHLQFRVYQKNLSSPLK